jgi:hypothetical protein
MSGAGCKPEVVADDQNDAIDPMRTILSRLGLSIARSAEFSPKGMGPHKVFG